MAKPHTPAEVKAFDTMKFWVAIILLLILLWQCSSNQSTKVHGSTPVAPHSLRTVAKECKAVSGVLNAEG